MRLTALTMGIASAAICITQTACDAPKQGITEVDPMNLPSRHSDIITSVSELLGLYPDAKQIATGHATYSDPDQTQTYSFNAIRHSDLSLTGRFEVHYSNISGQTLDEYGDITCLTIFGNVAEVGGIVSRVGPNNSFNVPTGVTAVWMVQDNGEGSTSPPDLASAVYTDLVPPLPRNFCGGNGLGAVPQDNGNIQVMQFK